MPALALVEPQLSSPARASLARLNEGFAAAIADLERDRAPEERLRNVVAQLDAVEAELRGFRERDDNALAAWLASGKGDRPSPLPETLACEQRLIQARRDGDAARTALPGLQEAVQRAAEQAKAMGMARADASYKVAVEAADAFASGPFLDAINMMLSREAVLVGLAAVLADLGREAGPGSPANQASMQVEEIRKAAKAAAGVSRRPEVGRQLLQSLLHDPAAELEPE
jgi:hypothetical protein